ncbi:hypothetical protein B8W69_04300 [Mycobacterium vulneris]|uniref:TniQ domain-containing protein n=1 Tax=Mycolicibacterium vulneris TaxID=547163 RepID=A0A1X2LCH6_9MYCO|nr:TniQ family protein [Mycolicibacterium vulneris]OSC31657.1 hypothetical protein B8W69_04300 [Mycolicibacterium vulneris]
MLELLPSRPALHPAEALDGYLERLAEANGLSTATLHKLMREALGTDPMALVFLMIKPQRAAVEAIADLGGADRAALTAATLVRYGDGLPLHLEGLDPSRRHTYRSLVAQGWFPPHGSQACPICLARDGIWRLEWRLPLVAVCRIHDVELLTQCAACQRRFRIRRHSPMRPSVGPDQLCGNPIGLQRHCAWPIVNQRTRRAAPAAVAAVNMVALALAGRRVDMLGREVDPRIFLAELRHVATMLLHLLTTARDSASPEWSRLIHNESASRTAELRNPRWGISPPRSSALRGHVLAEANAILGQSTLTNAGARLATWLAPISGVANGPNNWLLNRTTRTATTHELIIAALSGRHHVGRRLNGMRVRQLPPICAVPQLLDLELFVEFFDDMLGGYQWTGRLYVSLCLARSVTAAQNWPAAATQLGLDPAIGWRTARAASGRMRATPEVFADAVRRTLRVLPRDRNFRQRETRVAALASDPSAWFDRWRTSSRPDRRPASLLYAITWMWCEPAQGWLGASPAWQNSVTARAKASYREFSERLAPAAEAGLRSLVLDERPG